MGRWRDMGWIEKAALVSFGGSVVGVALAVVLSKLLESPEVAWAILLSWFAPFVAWVICALAVAAREAFGATAIVSTLVLILGSFTSPHLGETIPFVLVGTPMIVGAMALFGKPAAAALSLGKSEII